jgi:hypothetical protein
VAGGTVSRTATCALRAAALPHGKARAYESTRIETARLFAALQYYDYMAWLFNDEHITLGPAKGFWAPNMLDAYQVGTTFLPNGEIDAKFSEVAAFHWTADEGLWPCDPCRVGAVQRPRDPD